MNKIQVLLASGLSLFALASCSQQEPVLNEPNVNLAELDPNVVTLQEAVDMASEHYSGFFGTTRSGKPISLKGFEILRRAQTRTDETPDSYGYYILNFENDGGFAIVSADRRNEGVYAISDEGSLHLSDTLQNGGLNWYLNTCLRITPITPPIPPEPPYRDTTLHPIVQPKVEYVNYCTPRLTGFLSKFEQGEPYNKYCFTESGKQAMIGEFALAMGTMMGYYKTPKSYTVSAPTVTFNWDQMYNDPNNDGWARLFEIMGRPENTDALYGEEKTVCNEFLIDFPQTFQDNMQLKSYTYTNQPSADLLRNEMKAFRPCVMVGRSSSNTKTYFIIDGGQYRIITSTPLMGDPTTKTETYFHCIWGRGGTANGYYKLGEVSVGAQTDDGLIGPPDPHDDGTDGYVSKTLFGGIYYNFIPEK